MSIPIENIYSPNMVFANSHIALAFIYFYAGIAAKLNKLDVPHRFKNSSFFPE
jgi:hypothetical protein